MSRDSIVGIVTGYGLDGWQNCSLVYSNFYVLDSRREGKMFWTEW
jgi:hypothetical protein